MHTNFSGLTEVLGCLGLRCRTTHGEPLADRLSETHLLIVPPPTGRYDAVKERWRAERSSLFGGDEVSAILSFLHGGGRLLAFGYRFGDSFTRTNLGHLCNALGCQLNDDAVIDTRALRQTHPLQLHLEIPSECLLPSWARLGVNTVHWRPAATFTLVSGATASPLALSTGGASLSFDRTLRRISFEPLPLAVVGHHGAGRFALFGGPHVFESSSLGLLNSGNNRRFLENVLHWLLTDSDVAPVASQFAGLNWARDCHEVTRIEARGEGKRTIARVERVLRETGVLKALNRAKWMP